jgi:hypothetical protein
MGGAAPQAGFSEAMAACQIILLLVSGRLSGEIMLRIGRPGRSRACRFGTDEKAGIESADGSSNRRRGGQGLPPPPDRGRGGRWRPKAKSTKR